MHFCNPQWHSIITLSYFISISTPIIPQILRYYLQYYLPTCNMFVFPFIVTETNHSTPLLNRHWSTPIRQKALEGAMHDGRVTGELWDIASGLWDRFLLFPEPFTVTKTNHDISSSNWRLLKPMRQEALYYSNACWENDKELWDRDRCQDNC